MQKPAMPGPLNISNRRLPRAELNCDVSVNSETNFYTGMTRNISEGGLYIKADTDLPVGSIILLTFTLDDGLEPLELRGEIRWLDSQEGGGGSEVVGFGVRFLQLNEPDLARIRAFVNRRSPLMNPDE